MTNPFTPTFGVIPAHMAGREHIISELIRALEAGPGDPGLTTILTGARGTGKTALLSYLADEASSRGWIAANVSALPGMLDEILQQTLKYSSHLIRLSSGKTGVTGLEGPELGSIFSAQHKSQPQGGKAAGFEPEGIARLRDGWTAPYARQLRTLMRPKVMASPRRSSLAGRERV